MPYTQEELKKLSFYQNLIKADEEDYLLRKQTLLDNVAISGSADNGNELMRHKTDGTILLFENPWVDALPEDPSTKVIHSTIVKKLKTEESYGVLNEVLDRDFKEIT